MISVGVDIDRFGLMVILDNLKLLLNISSFKSYRKKISRLSHSAIKPNQKSWQIITNNSLSFTNLFIDTSSLLVLRHSLPSQRQGVTFRILTLLRHTTGLNESKDLKDYKQFSVKVNEVIQEIINELMSLIRRSQRNFRRTACNKLKDNWIGRSFGRCGIWRVC